MPVRLILALNLAGGICVGIISVFSYLYSIQMPLLLFAFPLLSLAMVINAFSTSRVRLINNNEENLTIDIVEENLFKTKVIHLDLNELNIEFLSPNKNKFFSIPKYQLKIYENKELKVELTSSFLSLNNVKIAKAFRALKDITQAKKI